MYLIGIIVAFFAAIVWESVFYHRNDGGLKSMTKREWIEDIIISLLSWFGIILIGISFYVSIFHKNIYEEITERKL